MSGARIRATTGWARSTAPSLRSGRGPGRPRPVRPLRGHSGASFPWRPILAEFGVDGYVSRYEKHLIYRKRLANGEVGVVTVRHERMHQIERFRDDFAS